MFDRIWGRIEKVESKLRNRFGNSLETPWQRFLSHVHFQLMDHGFLRILWTNFYQFSPGAYRSNQPSPARIKRYARRGIKTIINLRGSPSQSHYLFEKEACQQCEVELVNCSMWARSLTPKHFIIELLDVFDKIEHPFVVHCKSGADRASLAAAFYLIYKKGYTVEQTRNQFGLKYLHLKFSRTGVLDFLMDVFEREGQAQNISLRDWITSHYDAEALTNQFLENRS